MECNHKNHLECAKDKTCIDHVPIFDHLTNQEKESILLTSLHKKYQKGEFIFMPGDHFDNLLVVVSGLVKIVKYAASGKEQILSLLHPGDFMGEFYLFSQKETTNAAYVVEDTTLCIIQGKAIKQYILHNPEVALKFLEKYTKKIEEAENLIEQIGLRDVGARLAHYLLKESGAKASPIYLTLPTSKKDLASMLGTTSETLSRKLNEFQNNGWIHMNGQREIVIIKKNELEYLVD